MKPTDKIHLTVAIVLFIAWLVIDGLIADKRVPDPTVLADVLGFIKMVLGGQGAVYLAGLRGQPAADPLNSPAPAPISAAGTPTQ